jgi:hypothetical protein
MSPETKEAARKLARGALAVAVAATATYGALKPEEVARQAIAANTASYQVLADRVRDLQHWAEANRERVDEAKASCTAKADALIAFTQGYLMALSKAANGSSRQSRPAAPNGTPDEIKSLVKALSGSRKESPAQAQLPELVPPPDPPAIRK